MEAAEMKLLRHLACYILYDQIRNEDFRKRLKISAVTETIEKYNSWHERVLRVKTKERVWMTDGGIKFRPQIE